MTTLHLPRITGPPQSEHTCRPRGETLQQWRDRLRMLADFKTGEMPQHATGSPPAVPRYGTHVAAACWCHEICQTWPLTVSRKGSSGAGIAPQLLHQVGADAPELNTSIVKLQVTGLECVTIRVLVLVGA